MGSFYINRVLGFTQLDRFKTNLPIYPERFLSVARAIESNSLPDCDFNTSDQEPFLKASKDILGDNGCYMMMAFGTMKESEAFRNLCRAKELDITEYDEVAKNVEQYADHPRWRELIKESKKYIGTIVSASVHPCSALLMDKDIRSEVGILKIGDYYCAILTSSEADDWKYLKNDYLKVEVVRMISEVYKEIGIPIDSLNELRKKLDTLTYDIYKHGLTCTVNQADSDYGTALAKRYMPTSPEEFAKYTGAVRPNFEAYRETFIERKTYTSGINPMDDLFNSTDHFIIFQENLMQWFVWLGETPASAITLIKKISKKKIKQQDFDNLEANLRNNWKKQVGNDADFDRVWGDMQAMMNYGYNAPHALSMAYDSLYCAYLKSHFPLEYYTVAFNMYKTDIERTSKLKKELNYFKIKLEPIAFRYSDSEYSSDKENNTIYKGISSIKYCNAIIAKELLSLRDRDYPHFIDLLIDIKGRCNLNSRQMEILIKLNFFKEFGGNTKLLTIYNLFVKYNEKKQINKSKLSDIELPEYLIKRYAAKETNSLYKEIDFISLIKEYSSKFKNEADPINIQMKNELEYLGYIEYTNPKLPKNYYFVYKFKMNDYKRPYFSIKRISDGEEFKVKIKKSNTFLSQPFKDYNVLKIYKINKVFKKRKDANGKWITINETEYVIENYEIIV